MLPGKKDDFHRAGNMYEDLLQTVCQEHQLNRGYGKNRAKCSSKGSLKWDQTKGDSRSWRDGGTARRQRHRGAGVVRRQGAA